VLRAIFIPKYKFDYKINGLAMLKKQRDGGRQDLGKILYKSKHKIALFEFF
jgi:hypothetical protein